MQIIGDNLKQARKLLGLTQAEFARKLDVAQGTVQQWEAEVRNPDGKNLNAIVCLTGKPPEYFLSGKPEPGVDPELLAQRPRCFSNIRRFRQAKNLSHQDMIKALGFDKKQSMQFMTGVIPVQGEVLAKIAKFLDVSPEDITGGDPDYMLPDPVPTRPANADRTSLQRTAPMPPSKAKHVRQCRQVLRQAMDFLTEGQLPIMDLLDEDGQPLTPTQRAKVGVIQRAMLKLQRAVLAAQDELDKLMEG